MSVVASASTGLCELVGGEQETKAIAPHRHIGNTRRAILHVNSNSSHLGQLDIKRGTGHYLACLVGAQLPICAHLRALISACAVSLHAAPGRTAAIV